MSVFTLSSHVSMLTGVFPSQHTAVMTHMRASLARTPSVATLLASQGYRTGAFVGTNVLRADTGIADGFELYDDQVDPLVTHTSAWALVHDVQSVLALEFPVFHRNGLPHWFQTYQRPAGEVLERALAWIGADDPRPWLGKSSFPASGVDVAPTLLGLASVAAPEQRVGRDLSAGDLPETRDLLVEDLDQLRPERRQLALYRGTWKLVRTGSGKQAVHELFDLTQDAVGLVDRAAEHLGALRYVETD